MIFDIQLIRTLYWRRNWVLGAFKAIMEYCVRASRTANMHELNATLCNNAFKQLCLYLLIKLQHVRTCLRKYVGELSKFVSKNYTVGKQFD